MSSRRRHPGRLWLLLKQSMQGLFRLLFRLNGRRTGEAGFIFPTAVLLVLMVSLTAGALTYRAFSRSTQVIVERQQQVVENAATPAIDRAKAKLEYLFTRDLRPAPKVPPSDALENLLRATSANMLEDSDGAFSGEYDRLAIQPEDEDIYTLDGPNVDNPEERIDLNGDGKLDNAWVFNSDVDGNGVIEDTEVVVYSILVDHLNNDVGYDNPDQDKADNLVARNSSLTALASNPCVLQTALGQQQQAEEPISGEGWDRINSITTEKTIQVDAFAIDLADTNFADTVSTLEFQQIREASLANKWGAWFRYDLVATPGPEFNWNGAMHTQGSLFMANNFNAYMISSTNSCAYGDGASEITLGAENEDNNFRGQLVLGNNDFGFDNRQGAPTVHVDDDGNPEEPRVEGFSVANDTVTNQPGDINDIFLDPLELYLEDEARHIAFNFQGNSQDPNAAGSDFEGRVRNVDEADTSRISLDDTYRADNRYGPSKVYDQNAEEDGQIPTGTDIGEEIPNANTLLRGLQADGNGPGGLDGYWERQAVHNGTRFMVGQRLELGNASGWNHDPTGNDFGDPLYPPEEDAPTNEGLPPDRTGEHYQRKSLRDNLAAVQGAVVYNYAKMGGDGLEPAVCLATTAHHATYRTIANSRTFRERIDGNDVMLDFLTGNGTNGWEFDPVDRNDAQMRRALENLANFAGDPRGGAPTFTPVQDNDVHPFPYMAMWGDFSTLRRIIDGDPNANNSIADQSTLDTGACTLALLAYNIDAIEGEYGTVTPADETALNTTLDGLSGVDLATTSIEQLKDEVRTESGEQQALLLDIIWHHWVVDRDRRYGFADSPVADTDCEDEFEPTLGVDSSLSQAICRDRPFYPALYYIFPASAHDGDGTSGGDDDQTGIDEDYIDQTVDAYSENNNFGAFTLGQIASIAANPETKNSFPLPINDVGNFDFSLDWGNADSPDNHPWDLIVTDVDGDTTDAFGVSVLDKVIYSGRENIAIRLLDLNVRALMDDEWFLGEEGGEERFGLTYAFREDAAREDSIVRPTGGNFGACGDYNTYVEFGNGPADCYPTTAADVLDWTDPPLSPDHLISFKPVDYVPDPMRRPYGFRLREGEDFNRANDVASGLTFISNNAVAIQGDFNLHRETAPPVEEFTQTVFDADPGNGADTQGGAFYNAFYNRTNRDDAFADPGDDRWRPAEILGDVVYLFSGDFVDGFVEAAYASDAAGGDFQYEGNDYVSFQNMNRPADNNEQVPDADEYVREDPNAATDEESPIYFDRNGNVYLVGGTTISGDDSGADVPDPDFEYFPFNDFGRNPRPEFYRQDNLAAAAPTTINALIISGVVPSRPGQIYGGLHNFPRFNEDWENTRLQIAGGFFQLFFSHTSTGPYDMEAWEFDDIPTRGDGNNGRNIGYFWPPFRVWGYDVALQFAQQPPISSRFVTVGRARSELYKELDVEDPYIQMLRCAPNPLPNAPDAGQIDPEANCI